MADIIDLANPGTHAASLQAALLAQSGRVPTIAALGDSITAMGGSFVANRVKNARGFTTWMTMLGGQRFWMPDEFNFGISGQRTDQMLERLPAVLAARPSVCVVLAGTNDILPISGRPGLTPQNSLSNLQQIFDGLQAVGIVVIALPPLPRSDTPFNADDRRGHVRQIREFIRAQHYLRRNFHVVDCAMTLGDAVTGGPKTNPIVMPDLLHPNCHGAYLIGAEIEKVLRTLQPTARVPLADATDLYHPTLNPRGNLFPNGLMLGTGGQIGGGATGVIADGVKSTNALPAGVSAIFSKEPRDEGGEWQVLELSGSITNNAAPTRINIWPVAQFNGSVQPGDVVEAFCEFKVDAGAKGVCCTSLVQYLTGGTASKFAADNFGQGADPLIPPVAHGGTMRTPRLAKTDSTYAGAGIEVCVQATPSGTQDVALKLSFSALEMRKVL
ncbi:SGNH/GDSL hydrolase family protein [Terrihabitans sp. B22-R8]|uniref:SGNH/GDSL hydrolase family protein n=1 Tax=Terrihabitans sp. B22-R8 TaxID=3425128 RepID=UPI00403CC516